MSAAVTVAIAGGRFRRLACVGACLVVLDSASARAADILGITDLNQSARRSFVGAQIEAVKQSVRVAVQQAISALPPTAGQSFLYEIVPDEEVEIAFGKSPRLGPISFRAPEVLAPNSFDFRVATSYFQLSHDFAPVAYVGTSSQAPDVVAATKLGLNVDATAVVVNVSATYGTPFGLDVSVNAPITIVKATAREVFLAVNGNETLPGLRHIPIQVNFAHTTPREAVDVLDDGLRNGAFFFNDEEVTQLGGQLDQGAQLGFGRAGVALKKVLLNRDWLALAMSEELALPSPSSDELAGTNSFGALTRVILAAPLAKNVRLHIDAGYEFDSDFKELWRSVWNVGTSVWLRPFSSDDPQDATGNALIDFGFGGSKYLKELEWSPAVASQTARTEDGTLETQWVRQDPAGLGTNYVDFLAGGRLQLPYNTLVGAAVSVPITNDGLRPDVTATLSFEYYY